MGIFSHLLEGFEMPFKALWHVAASVGDLVTGDVSGAKANIENAGYSIYNPWQSNDASKKWAYSDAELAQQKQAAYADEQKQKADVYNRAVDPNANWNTSNWQNYSARAGQTFSAVAGDAPKPSDLLKISNPVVRTAIAQTRGNDRATLNQMGARANLASAQYLAKPTGAAATASAALVAPTAVDTPPINPAT